jgi:hypothetical protein
MSLRFLLPAIAASLVLGLLILSGPTPFIKAATGMADVVLSAR